MGRNSKAEREIDELAAGYGFTRVPGYTKNGHIKYTKGSKIVFASTTNNDPKAMNNLEAEFKRRA